MLCDMCKEREATVHLTQVADGNVKKLHLCPDCAAKSGFDLEGPLGVTEILLAMSGAGAPEEANAPERSCPRCHLRRSDFKKTGRLGCPDCYDTFAAELTPLIKGMHRSEQHSGKIPSREAARLKASAERAELEKALEQAIRDEKFEEAARLRDRIRACRNGPGGAG